MAKSPTHARDVNTAAHSKPGTAIGGLITLNRL